MNYSITQGANYASLVATIGIIIRIVNEPGSVTAEEWQVVGLALLGAISAAASWINRYRRGDVTLAGFKEE